MGQHIKVKSREGGPFDCYLAVPEGPGRTPAVVLASAVHGVNEDIRALVDEFAARLYRRRA